MDGSQPDRHRSEGDAATRPDETAASLAAILSGANTIAGNDDASLHDIGDGLAVFEIHRKMNSIDHVVLDVLEEALALAGRRFRALIIANTSPRAFSAGADLNYFLRTIEDRDFSGLARFISRGQALFLAMKYAPVPVVAAVQGVALGGGCELTLHADAVVAHADAQFGLPETKLGVLPGWGGCTQMLVRAQERAMPGGPLAIAASAFDPVFRAYVSRSASEARDRGLLRSGDSIVAQGDDLFAAAKSRALQLAGDYTPPQKALVAVAGQSGWLGLMQPVHAAAHAGRLSDTDCRIAEAIAGVMTGGPQGDPLWRMTEEDLTRRECDALVALAKTPETRDRMAHFMRTGQPLRN